MKKLFAVVTICVLSGALALAQTGGSGSSGGSTGQSGTTSPSTDTGKSGKKN